MVTEHPAKMLGLFPRTGAIQSGSDANFTLIDWQSDAGKLVVLQTVVGGEVVYER
jgi:N-acetylglucosamine-6-phosphate deacetylase